MNPLDKLLPRITPSAEPEWHANAAVLETAEPSQLAELAADKKVRPFLLGRLSDTVALVDPGQADALEKTLLETGHTPKLTDGPEG